MRRTPSTQRIPLPTVWPRRVRSAVVHAVAMAQVALSLARARAERDGDAVVRLQVDNDRVRKDARMSRLPAQRRPHYPPIERLAILELRAHTTPRTVYV